MEPVDDAALASLVRGFYHAYMERFEALAERRPEPAHEPVPVLAASSLELVRVNGGQAVHFFFTEPSDERVPLMRRVTKVHDIEVWPPSTDELKALAEGRPDAHRDQVRKTAAIDGALYVHFVVYPHDGKLTQILHHVAGLVAEREVRGASVDGPDNEKSNPTGKSHHVEGEGPVRRFDSGPTEPHAAVDEWFHVDK